MEGQLLALLRARANHRGLVLARQDRLCAELGCSPEALAAGLNELVARRSVEILTPLPYLILALLPRSWSGRSTARARNPPQSRSKSRPSQEEVPVSSSEAAAVFKKEEGGAGEEGGLLAEALAVLGSGNDATEVATLLKRYSPSLIRRCLRRVRATASIRTSRLALFRALLLKLTR